jgi:nicotinamidase-related amidase
MSDHKAIPIEQSALLVVDVQEGFKVGPRWERRSTPRFEENLVRLIQSYRSAGLPVIFVLHTDEDEAFERDSPYLRLMDFLQPGEGEPTILKNTRNSFTSTNLQELLEARGVRRLAVTGISTEQCCETTTRVAADLGYDVDFVTEATMTFPILNRETGEELSTDEVIRRTEFVLRGRFARIATVDQLVEELERAAVPCSA